MIIELVGPPASGKSTAVKELTHNGIAVNARLDGKKEIIVWGVLALVCHPIWFVTLFFLILKNSTSLTMVYFKCINLLFVRGGKYQKAKWLAKRQPLPVLIDEGHIQNFLSLYEKPVTQKKLNRYLRLIPKTNKLALFTVPELELRKRIAERGNSGRDFLGQSYVDKWLTALFKNHHLLVEALPTKITKTVFVSNTADLRAITNNHE